MNPTWSRRRFAQPRRLVAIGAIGVLATLPLTVTSLASAPPASEPAGTAPDGSNPLSSFDDLVGGLLDAAVLGVPDEWVVSDYDSSLFADVSVSVPDSVAPGDTYPGEDLVTADLDPFLGLLSCPEGTIQDVGGVTWVARRYSAPEVPLDNGLLSIDIIVERETSSEADADAAALAECSVGEQARLTIGSATLEAPRSGTEDTDPVDATTIELLASPSATIAYPSAFDATIVNSGDRTVTVILGGIDMGESWQPLAADIAVTSLEHLVDVSTPATVPNSDTSTT